MLADVNWKSYVCIKLFFLDLADMYNHIKMVLTHTHTNTGLHPICYATTNGRMYLFLSYFRYKMLSSDLSGTFHFRVQTLFHVYLLPVLSALVQIVHTCSLSIQRVG